MEETKIEKKAAEPASKPHKGPSYFAVFLILAALTGIEIAITYLPIPRAPVLIPLAVVKAALVAMFYMHLRTDRRIFSFVFVAGILFGVTLVITFLILINAAQTSSY